MIGPTNASCRQTRLVRGLLLGLLSALIAGVMGVFSPHETNGQGFIPSPPVVVDEPVVRSEAETFVNRPLPFTTPINEQILTLAFSPDGKKLVTAGAHHQRPGQLQIWDLATGKASVTVRRIPGVRAVAFSPDGQTIATGDFSWAVRLRDAETGEERAVLTGHKVGVNGLAFSRDGLSLVSAGLDRTVKLWDVKERKEKKEFLGHTEMVFGVAFFPDGQTIVSGGRDQTARIWDVATGKEKFTLKGHRSGVEAVAVSPDGKTVATASWDQTVKLWDAETGKEKATLADNGGSVNSVAFSPVDGNLLAVATGAGTIRLWDAKTQKVIRTLEKQPLAVFGAGAVGLLGTASGPGALLTALTLAVPPPRIHDSGIWAVAFSSDGKFLASGSSDKTARVWNVAAVKEAVVARETAILSAAMPKSKSVQALAYAPDGKVLALVADGGTVQVRDARTGDVLFVLEGGGGVTSVAFSPDGRTLAGGRKDGGLALWDRTTGKEKFAWKGHVGPVHALAFRPDGKKLASAGDDKSIKIWDAASGRAQATFKGHTAAVRALAFRPDGRVLASGGADKSIKIWNMAEEKESVALVGHEGTVRALAYSAELLASAGEDGAVKLWAPNQASPRSTLKGHPGPVTSLAFSPIGRTLVSGGKDGVLIVWDLVRGQPRQYLLGHNAEVTGIAFHPRGHHLITAGEDATLRWSGADGVFPLRTLRGNPAGVRFATFSPTGAWLASGGGGGVDRWSPVLSRARHPFFQRTLAHWDAAYSPDGRTLALATRTGTQICDAATGRILSILPAERIVRLVAYSPDGTHLSVCVAGSNNPDMPSQIRLYTVAGWQEVGRWNGPSDTTHALRFSPDGKVLASSEQDRSILIREVPSGKLVGTLRGHGAPARGLVFLPDRTLATAGWDGTIRFWDVKECQETKMWQVGRALASLDVSPDGTMLAAADGARLTPAVLTVWELGSGKEKFKLGGHKGHINAAAFTRDGRGLIGVGGVNGQYGEVSYWDLSTGRRRGGTRVGRQANVRIALDPTGQRVAVASAGGMSFWELAFLHKELSWTAGTAAATCGLFVPGSNLLVVGSEEGDIKVWAAGNARLVATLKGHTKTVRALALLPDGKTLFSASDDTTVKSWDLSDFTAKGTLVGHKLPVSSMAVHPDGKILATGGGDPAKLGAGELILWDLTTGKVQKTIPGIDAAVGSVAYSPDRMLLAVGAAGVIQVRDTKTDAVRATLPAPGVGALLFSPDSKLLAVGQGKSASIDSPEAVVALWDVATWKQRAVLQEHQQRINTVSFSPDGATLASASQDGTIKLCSLPPAWSSRAIVAPLTGKISIGDFQPTIVRPAPPPVVVPPVVVEKPLPRPPVTPKKPKSLAWLPMAELVALVITLAMVIGMGVFLRVRQGGGVGLDDEPIIDTAIEEPEDEPIIDTAVEEPEEPPPPAPISFHCSECGKHFKAPPELAGKKIKCRKCGKPTVVPESKTNGDTRVSRPDSPGSRGTPPRVP